MLDQRRISILGLLYLFTETSRGFQIVDRNPQVLRCGNLCLREQKELHAHDNPLQVASSDVMADRLGVRRGSHAPRIVWKFSWRIHGYLLPLLHAWDQARSKDLDYSLKCLWCKALSGRDPDSPAFDGGMTYDMLPSGSRWILKLPRSFFPRLIHFNIELRTAYIDQALREEIARIRSRDAECRIQLITLGAGYDTRSTRFLTNGLVDEAWELDVEAVMESKRIMLERLQQRRKKRKQAIKVPFLMTQDLNDLEGVKDVLSNALNDTHTTCTEKAGEEGYPKCHTIFIFEGVLIYLRDGIPRRILSAISSIIQTRDRPASIIFADLFRDLRGMESMDEIQTHFQRELGWDLDLNSFCVKPGLARHMGVARIVENN